MKELSIFVDESGDFCNYNSKYALQYIFSMVIHEQDRDITEAINANFPGFYNSKGKSELIKLCFPGMLESRLWISCSYESH